MIERDTISINQPSVTNHLQTLFDSSSYREQSHISSVISAYTRAVPLVGVQHSGNEKARSAAFQDLEDIALRDSLKGHTFKRVYPRSYPGRSASYDHYDRRARLLQIYVKSPELAATIVSEEIDGFHGTVSGALPGILEHGLVPLVQQRDEHMLPIAGERIFAFHEGGIEIATSFVQWQELEQISMYFGSGKETTPESIQKEIDQSESGILKFIAAHNADPYGKFVNNYRKVIDEKRRLLSFLQTPPQNSNEALLQSLIKSNFPVVVGIHTKDIARERMWIPQSHIHREFVVEGGVPRESIGLLLVDEPHVEFTQNLVDQSGSDTSVFPLEDALVNKSAL
ncbi:MAG: hypothetical protein HZC02_00430 [Candidatus Levybacteria bacterium]|nr:hypothetical protein [Candidatus Levybacteria bacterium]